MRTASIAPMLEYLVPSCGTSSEGLGRCGLVGGGVELEVGSEISRLL